MDLSSSREDPLMTQVMASNKVRSASSASEDAHRDVSTFWCLEGELGRLPTLSYHDAA